jgi:N-acetylmuramoyl-L-alanine amidase
MFYVLYRAQMPSILVEVSYVTNKEESRRLRTSTYRARAASSIAQGIDQYFKEEPSVLKVAMR